MRTFCVYTNACTSACVFENELLLMPLFFDWEYTMNFPFFDDVLAFVLPSVIPVEIICVFQCRACTPITLSILIGELSSQQYCVLVQ